MGKAAPKNPYDDLQLHECCAEIPPMTAEEMGRVAEDIRLHGLRRRILKHGNLIIDGRSRWTILKKLGVTLGPEHFEEWDGEGDVFELAMSLNAHRRHLGPGALASLAAKAKGRLAGTVPDARAAAAKRVGVSAGYITQYERIEAADPDVAREVAEGRTTIPQAERRLGLAKAEANGHARRNGLPNGTLIDIKDPAEPTRLQDIVEDHEERKAIQQDVSDEVWAEALPLASQLAGKARAMFLRGALNYRRAEAERKAYAAKIGSLIRGNVALDPWTLDQRRALSCNPPEDWVQCPPLKDGGCGGTGSVGFGNERAACRRCHGSGYLVR